MRTGPARGPGGPGWDISRRGLLRLGGLALAGGGSARPAPAWAAASFDVRAFGAAGNGAALDTAAVNRAIAAAAAAGGGTVRFAAGSYRCHSIRLKSFVALYLEPGATIRAAPAGGYDAAEPTGPWARYQDFGHNHWHNSLIWGEGIQDAAILGPGLIDGTGLSRGEVAEPGLAASTAPGAADKAIALKSCRNIILRDISIFAAGHFGILATGVDNLTIDDIKIDTNRDGINIDGCRDVRITGCRVNSPWDDGICLKSSFALGKAVATENVTISDCYLTGYQLGSLLDGSFRPLPAPAQPTGRIKLGTESNGGFRNIAVSNCVFESCRGFALETVDGGAAENITVTAITMRDIRNAPIFLRLGARMRGPAGGAVGTMRRVIISGVTCEGRQNAMPAIIAGLPGHPVEDVSLRDIYLLQKGGGAAALATVAPPEEASRYPEPGLFAPLPAQGLFVRHARDLEVRHLEIATVTPDARPFVWLGDVNGADVRSLRLPPGTTAPAFQLHDVRAFRDADSFPAADTAFDAVTSATLP